MKRLCILLLVLMNVCCALAEGTLPQIDSSTARIPITDAIYAHFTGQGWTGPEPICSKTHGAWLNLASGDADIIFLIAPSADELSAFADAGVDIEMKVYGCDGLVFLGNASNPVESLTGAQIRAIYRGDETNWYFVKNGENAEIEVYIRDPESGSQRSFETLVWNGYEMPDFESLGFEHGEVTAAHPHRMEVYRDMNSITTSIMRARYSIGFNILSYVDNVFLSSKGLERTVETTARVHLRWEPDRESASQCVIPADTVVPYLGDTVLDDRDVAWYEVRYEDYYGYVCSKYAKLHVDETSLKLFAIDGYEPNTENFRTGKYPYVTTSYVAIRADEPADSPARRLFDWVGSKESEKIIQENSTLSVTFTDPVTVVTREDDAARAMELAVDLAERDLSRDELRPFTQAEVELLWHAVYAWSGRHFPDAQPRLRALFEGSSWYRDEGRSYLEAEALFNDHQKANLALLEDWLAQLRRARANVQPRVLDYSWYDETMTGEDVRQAQKALEPYEVDPGPVIYQYAEGEFGRSTQEKLQAFQRQNGLEETGRLDAVSRLMLLDIEL